MAKDVTALFRDASELSEHDRATLAGLLIDVLGVILQYRFQVSRICGLKQHGMKDMELSFAGKGQSHGLAKGVFGILREVGG